MKSTATRHISSMGPQLSYIMGSYVLCSSYAKWQLALSYGVPNFTNMAFTNIRQYVNMSIHMHRVVCILLYLDITVPFMSDLVWIWVTNQSNVKDLSW